MNNVDKQYFELLNLVLNEGKVKKNRTGQDTLGVFGAQARFNLAEGFPILTTKRIYWKGVVHELLWFLSGSTNIKYLVDNNVNIWNADCYKKYSNYYGKYDQVTLSKMKTDDLRFVAYDPFSKDKILRYFILEEFVEKIKTDDEFAQRWGELGDGAYGQMWREFPYYYEDPRAVAYEDIVQCRYVDQISKIIDSLKNNPNSRRHIVSAWHPYLVDHVVLPPCHVLFQFHTEELTYHERIKWMTKNNKQLGPFTNNLEADLDSGGIPKYRLNCQLYQRSADLFLGVPFNISSYSLLTCMIAQCVNMIPGEFIHTFGDLHLYKGHVQHAIDQLDREPKELPVLKLNQNIKNVFDFKFEDISLENYNPHLAIKAELFV